MTVKELQDYVKEDRMKVLKGYSGLDDECWDSDFEKDVSELQGKTLTDIKNYSNEELVFTTSEGERYLMFHKASCCEEVYLDDICGDLEDLLGSPLVEAEEVSGEEPEVGDSYKSYTWTFYKFRTMKGSVTLRWFGSSNGYYGESVNFRKVPEDA